MNETDFISSIDCRFPYNDENKWINIMSRAIAISPNAMFMVLHELCRVPASANISQEKLLNIITEWENIFEHSAKEFVVEAGKAIIQNCLFSESKTVDYLKKIEPFDGQYNALTIIYFASNDFTDKIEQYYSEILNQWSN